MTVLRKMMTRKREELKLELDRLLAEYDAFRRTDRGKEREGDLYKTEFGLILNATDQVRALTEAEFEKANEFKQTLLLRAMQSVNNKLAYVVSFAERLNAISGKGYDLDVFYKGMKSEFTSLLNEANALKDSAYVRVLKGFFNTFSHMVDKMRGRTQSFVTKDQIKKEQDLYALVRVDFQKDLVNYKLKHKDNPNMMPLHQVAENLLSHANKVSESSLKDNHEVMALMNRDLDDASKIIRSADENGKDEAIEALNRMMNRRSFQAEDRTWSEYIRAKLTFRNVAIAVTLCVVAGAIIFFTGGAGIPLVAPLCVYGPALLSTAVAGVSGIALSVPAQAAFALNWMVSTLNPITVTAFLQQSGFGHSLLGTFGAGFVYGASVALTASSILFAGAYGANKVLGWAYNLVVGREPNAEEGMKRANDTLLRDGLPDGVFGVGDPGLLDDVGDSRLLDDVGEQVQHQVTQRVTSDLSHEDPAVVSVENPVYKFKRKITADAAPSPDEEEMQEQNDENPLRRNP